jgi:hypothetical protein
MSKSDQPAGVAVDRGVRPADEALHAAVCQAVALLNRSPEVVRIAEGREAHQILRLALADYADGYMNAPVTPQNLKRWRGSPTASRA